MRWCGLWLAGAFLLGACAARSPYEAGKSAADVPARIDVIKLDKFAPLELWTRGGDLEARVDGKPSDNEREVMAVAKQAVVAQFENFGMHVVEDDSRAADVRIRVYVSYVPEAGLLVHRAVRVTIRVFDTDGTPIVMLGAARLNRNGIIDALFTSRDAMVADVARQAVQNTVKELEMGTKKAPGTGATALAGQRPIGAKPAPASAAAVPSY